MTDNYDVFICYRRSDDHSAGRLFERLRTQFRTFYDQVMEGGSVFTPQTLAALRTAPVVIAIIGRGWMSSVEQLQSPEDWVRRELVEVIKRKDDVLLIPVLVDDVEVPDSKTLPPALHPLCERQVKRFRADTWELEVEALVRLIKARLPEPPEPVNADRKPPAANADEPKDIAQKAVVQPPPRSSGFRGIILVPAALLVLLAGTFVPGGWEWARARIWPSFTGADLDIHAYHPQLTCELPLNARAGATVTFHNTVISGARRCKPQLEAALKRGVQLRFLLIHPYAATLELRAREFRGAFPLSGYRGETVNCLEVLQEIREELAHTPGLEIDTALQVRFFDELPNMPIYVVQYEKNPRDNVLYQGFFLPFETGAANLPAVELRSRDNDADSRLFMPLLSYVEDKWKESTPVPLSEKHKHDDWLKLLAKIPVRYRAIEESAAMRLPR